MGFLSLSITEPIYRCDGRLRVADERTQGVKEEVAFRVVSHLDIGKTREAKEESWNKGEEVS